MLCETWRAHPCRSHHLRRSDPRPEPFADFGTQRLSVDLFKALRRWNTTTETIWRDLALFLEQITREQKDGKRAARSLDRTLDV